MFYFVYTQLNIKTILFQTFQLGISTQIQCEKSSFSNNSVEKKYTALMSKTVIFHTIQLSNCFRTVDELFF